MIAGSDPISEVESLAAQLAPLPLPQRLQLAVSIACTGAVRFTTSFGLKDQVITHAIMLNAPEIEIVTIDTGRLFPETHDVWAETKAHYARRIRAVSSDGQKVEGFVAQNGINGFRELDREPSRLLRHPEGRAAAPRACRRERLDHRFAHRTIGASPLDAFRRIRR